MQNQDNQFLFQNKSNKKIASDYSIQARTAQDSNGKKAKRFFSSIKFKTVFTLLVIFLTMASTIIITFVIYFPLSFSSLEAQISQQDSRNGIRNTEK